MNEYDDQQDYDSSTIPHYDSNPVEEEPPKVSAAVKAERRTSKLPVFGRPTGLPVPKKAAETNTTRTTTTASSSRLAQLATRKPPAAKATPTPTPTVTRQPSTRKPAG